MIAANVLSKEEFPDFDEETGILPKVDDEEGNLPLGLAGGGVGRVIASCIARAGCLWFPSEFSQFGQSVGSQCRS